MLKISEENLGRFKGDDISKGRRFPGRATWRSEIQESARGLLSEIEQHPARVMDRFIRSKPGNGAPEDHQTSMLREQLIYWWDSYIGQSFARQTADKLRAVAGYLERLIVRAQPGIDFSLLFRFQKPSDTLHNELVLAYNELLQVDQQFELVRQTIVNEIVDAVSKRLENAERRSLPRSEGAEDVRPDPRQK